MKVFSFCLYGTAPMYYTGLLENVRIIQQYYPDFEIYVYRGVCDPAWTLSGVNVIDTGREGAINMLYRYLPLTFADVGFVRDTDSRITPRDRWCMDAFLASDKHYHIIRDHALHKSRIMGGLFGWKRPLDVALRLDEPAGYGHDERVLASQVYPRIVADALVHTNVSAFAGETTARIEAPMADAHDFVGNVITDAGPQFTYAFSLVDQVLFLQAQDQFALVDYLTCDTDPASIPYDRRTTFYDAAYIAQYYLGNVTRAQYWLAQFEFADITPHVYRNAGYLFPRLGKRIVASFDPARVPGPDEVVIVYGNYPDTFEALPCSNKLRRHVSLFFEVAHDVVEYHPSWDAVDYIYVLGLRERDDRWYETLATLASVRAPLHRVHRYIAERDSRPAYVGATQNHVDVIEHFCQSGRATCLVLEDDFVFVDADTVWSSLTAVRAGYDYNICFLSLSRTGPREAHDALLGKTTQACTTSSGYLLRRETARAVLDTARAGLAHMVATGDQVTGCIDRYWSRLPGLYYFRRKLGFQRPGYSNIRGTVTAHLD